MFGVLNQQPGSFRTSGKNLVKKVMYLWFGLTMDITSPALSGKYFQFLSRAEISTFLEAVKNEVHSPGKI